MCGGGKAPSIPEPKPIAPRPTIEPQESTPTGRESDRNKRIKEYRSGFASTIKTSPFGLQEDQQGKSKLGQ